MRHRLPAIRAVAAVAVSLVALVATACGGESAPGPVSADDFDASSFEDAITIDNEWLPLEPGMEFVWEGEVIEEDETIPHRLVRTVTDLTKTIGDVQTVVIWERDFSADELVEAELAFFAQDDDGNVWRIGEYPEEYEDGELVAAPAWIAGLAGARAGIAMQAEPRLGTPDYSQGFAPAPVEFTDRGKVGQVGESTCVPVDCYDDVVVIDEFNPEEPGAFQLKYYARGVGNVRVGWRGEQDGKETLVLVEVKRLSPESLAEARAEALKLEESAYEQSEDVYAQTPPATPATE